MQVVFYKCYCAEYNIKIYIKKIEKRFNLKCLFKKFWIWFLSVNLGAICVGLTMGWPNPSIESDIYGRNQNFGFEDSLELQTVMNFGASIGAFCPMLIADIYGRRFSFLCSGISCSIFWIFMAFAANGTVKLDIFLNYGCWLFAKFWNGDGPLKCLIKSFFLIFKKKFFKNTNLEKSNCVKNCDFLIHCIRNSFLLTRKSSLIFIRFKQKISRWQTWTLKFL